MDLSPIFPAFLLNPAWPPFVTAPPRYGDGIGNREAAQRYAKPENTGVVARSVRCGTTASEALKRALP